MVFSHFGFPHKNIGVLCTVYVYDCSFVHCLFTLQLLDNNATLI